jgi:hypothetical protein
VLIAHRDLARRVHDLVEQIFDDHAGALDHQFVVVDEVKRAALPARFNLFQRYARLRVVTLCLCRERRDPHCGLYRAPCGFRGGFNAHERRFVRLP